MSSPLRTKKAGKENEFTGSPTKESSGKIILFKISIEPICQQLSKKETLSEMTNIVLQSLKPMDVNTSFDEEVPDNEDPIFMDDDELDNRCLRLL